MASVADLFENMPQVFNAVKAGNMDATVQFDLSGEGGGQWYVIVSGGKCTTAKGKSDAPTATIRMDAADYVALVKGELNAMEAFMQQKIRVEGDLSTVMKFQTLFD